MSECSSFWPLQTKLTGQAEHLIRHGVLNAGNTDVSETALCLLLLSFLKGSLLPGYWKSKRAIYLCTSFVYIYTNKKAMTMGYGLTLQAGTRAVIYGSGSVL